jgi:hypothetical protein
VAESKHTSESGVIPRFTIQLWWSDELDDWRSRVCRRGTPIDTSAPDDLDVVMQHAIGVIHRDRAGYRDDEHAARQRTYYVVPIIVNAGTRTATEQRLLFGPFVCDEAEGLRVAENAAKHALQFTGNVEVRKAEVLHV